jgi:hypothetical protein
LLLNIRGWRRLTEDRNIWKRTTEEARAQWGMSRYTRGRIRRKEEGKTYSTGLCVTHMEMNDKSS